LSDCDGQTAIAEVCQLGAEIVLMRQLATTNLIEQILQPENALTLLHILRNIVDRKDVHIDPYLIALYLVFHHPRAPVYHFGKGIVIVRLTLRVNHAVDAPWVLIGI
jgi:hypothetical protein